LCFWTFGKNAGLRDEGNIPAKTGSFLELLRSSCFRRAFPFRSSATSVGVVSRVVATACLRRAHSRTRACYTFDDSHWTASDLQAPHVEGNGEQHAPEGVDDVRSAAVVRR
jgi:hypothetical protein